MHPRVPVGTSESLSASGLGAEGAAGSVDNTAHLSVHRAVLSYAREELWALGATCQ